MKKIVFILSATIFFFSCREKQFGAFTVSGIIEHGSGKKILLEELPFNGQNAIVLDSLTLKPNGSFEVRGMGKEEGLYRLKIGDNTGVLLVNDGKSIKLQLDMNNYKAYKVDGSAASESLHSLFEDYRAKDSALLATFTLLDSLQKQKTGDSVLSIIRAKRDEQIKDMNALVTDFINQSPSPAARYYALGMASRTMNQDEVLALATVSADKFKEHSGLAIIKSQLSVQKPAVPQYALLNKQAPEITLPDVNGKPFSLSSLKGKYVLVDFWASWCGPCRKENPNVVAAYNKYRNKNFTILGVSLDKEKENWEQAIKDDKLSWTHISDLKQWESSVVNLYHFEGIPFNVLVDPQGKIIASELRGEELDKKLAEVLK